MLALAALLMMLLLLMSSSGAEATSSTRRLAYLLPWQVRGRTAAHDRYDWDGTRYCDSQVAQVATAAFPFTGKLSGPCASGTLGWMAECRQHRQQALRQTLPPQIAAQ